MGKGSKKGLDFSQVGGGAFVSGFKSYFGFAMGMMAYFLIVLVMLGGVVGGYFLAKSGGGFPHEDKNNNNDNDNDNGNGNDSNGNNDKSDKEKERNNAKIYSGYILMGICGLIAFIMLLPFILEGMARMFGYIIAVSIYDSFN